MSTLRRDNGIPATAPEPLAVRAERVILGGMVVWAVLLVATLLVPTLHRDNRDWWPWVCVVGLILGALGYLYVRRGRGNASSAHEADPQEHY